MRIAIVVDRAERIRVHLSDVHLPPGATIWSWGHDRIPEGPLRLDQVEPSNGVWLPSAPGPKLTIAVQFPGNTAAGSYTFRVDRIADIVDEDGPAVRSPTGPCLEDYACYTHPPAVIAAASATGRMSFISDGGSYLCTGTLLNDIDDSSVIAWFLTANHCISTQFEAASLEVIWDYVRPSCSSARPNLNALPRSVGATLVAHDPTTDFSLLRLATVPGPRNLLGWTTDAPNAGETLYRVHHPSGDVRHVSTSVPSIGYLSCQGSRRQPPFSTKLQPSEPPPMAARAPPSLSIEGGVRRSSGSCSVPVDRTRRISAWSATSRSTDASA